MSAQEPPPGEPEERPRPRGYGERRILEELPKIDCLTFGECLGYGHFSHVYEGMYKGKYPAAIKIIERGSERLVEREIRLLRALKGSPHIVRLYKVLDAGNTLLVFELLKGMSQETFYQEVSLSCFRHVLRCLFEALASAHEKGIVHRDVKLGNILISPDWKTVRLIDWGCGSTVKPRMSPRAGSRPVRSPEMLLGSFEYGTECDMWSMGTFIFTVLCMGELPWRCPSSMDTVVVLASFFGRQNILALAEQYGTDIPPEFRQKIENAPRDHLHSHFDEQMSDMQDKNLIDLMHRLLTLDRKKRYTAKQALEHPFFAEEASGDEYEYSYS